MSAIKPKIKIDIVSDIVCPWCYVGKKRFEKAIESLKDQIDFEIDFKAFELNPDVQGNQILLEEYLVSKFGSKEKLDEMNNHLSAVASEEGIEMNFSKIKYIPNSLLAHKLLKLSPDFETKSKLNEALLKAYFTDGINVGEISNLIQIARNIGISEAQITNFQNNSNVDDVLEEENFYRKSGINAVPSFIINNEYLIQGAQPTSTFIGAFQQVSSNSVEQAPSCGCGDSNCGN